MKYNININPSVYNDKFFPLLDNWDRYLVSYGGGGSGKSYSIAQIIIQRMMQEKMYNLLVVRNVGRTNRDSTFALLKQVISKWNLNQLFTINSADLRIKCINGNEIIFSGLDDVEKLKSITFSKGELTSIWIEEASEILESDFNQLDIRLRGKGAKHQIILTFNPIDINHWLKHRFIDDTQDNATVIHSTYLDNKFLDEEYKRLLESYKDTDKYYYDVYCLGNWGILGQSVFDAQKISERMQVLPTPIKTGRFEYDYNELAITNARFINDDSGYIKVFKDVNKNGIYEIGVDTSGEGSDFNVAQVLDANSGEQVAIMRYNKDIDLFTRQLYCLGHYYNYALLTIETNFDTFVIKELERLGYKHQFVREVQDTFSGQLKKAFGFRTDSVSRPRIISQLIEIVREHTELFNDKTTLEEMLTFVRNEKGRAEAQVGSHDDCVMSMCIAQEGLKQVIFKPSVTHRRTDEEDYFDYGND